MMKLAHIVHPVIVGKDSDLNIAQPIAFKSMQEAKVFTDREIDIELYAIQYEDETALPLPDCFIRIPGLTRSVGDIKAFKKRRKLALIKDILDALFKEAGDSDYLIYSNADITLQPYFYMTVWKIIQKGYDAFVINRRTISDKYCAIDELPLIYAEIGEKHQGWDCFIFRRALYPRFELGHTCIGTGWIGRVMITNMACFATKFEIFKDFHLTSHIGNDQIWKTEVYDDFLIHNREECRKILIHFEKKYGEFKRSEYPGRFLNLLHKGDSSIKT